MKTCRRLTTTATGEALEPAAAAPVVLCYRAVDADVTGWPRHTGAPEPLHGKVVRTPRRLQTLQENEGLMSCLFERVLAIRTFAINRGKADALGVRLAINDLEPCDQLWRLYSGGHSPSVWALSRPLFTWYTDSVNSRCTLYYLTSEKQSANPEDRHPFFCLLATSKSNT